MNAHVNYRLAGLAALILAASFSLALFAQRLQTGDIQARAGRITSIEDKGAGDIRITISLDSGTAPGVQAVGGGPIPVTLGMPVRLCFAFGTALFNPAIGSVIQVNEEKNTCVAQVDDDLLNSTFENPSNQEKHKVREFFKEGAEVSLCPEGKC